MKAIVKNMAGEQVSEVELNDAIFAAPVNQPLMHQALVRQLANARLGTHKVKNRSAVAGGGAKPWRQKGTGRARQGTIRAPQWRHGGVVFGPTPRSYRKQMPRKMRRAALRSALSVRVAENALVFVDSLAFDAPKTRDMEAFLERLDVLGSALLLLPDRNENVELAARNIPDVKVLRASYLNIKDLLGYETLVLPLAALPAIESFLA